MLKTQYSQEEIERKRQLALQRKQQAQQNTLPQNNVSLNNSGSQNTPSSKYNQFHKNGSQGQANGRGFSPSGSYGNNRTAKFSRSPLVMRSSGQSNRHNPIETKTPKMFFGKSPNLELKCYMVSNERFAVETSSYHQQVIEVYKTIPSKSYDMQSRIWDFHLKDYDALMGKLIHMQPDVTVKGIPKVVLQTFKKNLDDSTDLSNIDLSRIESNLVESLFPFQRDGVCFGISKNGRCMIADEMGLGKTRQALAIAHYYRQDWPLLIISPSSVRYQWSEAIFEFLPSVPTQYIQHFTNGKDYIGDAKIVIVSYDLMARAKEIFEKHNWGVIILDESHFMKSGKTARTQVAQRLAKRARRVMLLSGTPALSRPLELFSQIEAVVPRFMMFHDYGMRYCAGEKKPYGWDYTGSSNMQELQLLLKILCLIRRLKTDVLTQLPPKTRQTIVLDPVLIKAGTKEMKEMSTNMQRESLRGIEMQQALLQYFHESSKAKLKAVCNYVKDLLEASRKFLIFAHHQNMMDEIAKVVEANKVGYIRIDGKTNSEQRKVYVDRFQENEDCLVAVLSITAANSGITLTAAQLVVFAELPWNPAFLSQAEDRVHRIGQKENVVIQYLLAKQTSDDYVWPLLQNKTNVLNSCGFEQNFCIKTAKTTNQEISKSGQSTIDTYVTKINDRSSGEVSEMAKLLDEDIEELNSIDLECIAKEFNSDCV